MARKVILLGLIFNCLAFGLCTSPKCFRFSLNEASCSAGELMNTAFKLIPGPAGKDGESCFDSEKGKALLERVANLEKNLKNTEAEGKKERNALHERLENLEKKLNEKKEPAQSYTYKAYYDELKWHKARQFCIKRGGDLASHGVKTAAGRIKVFNELGITQKWDTFFIGATDLYDKVKYRYVDGTLVNKQEFGLTTSHPRREDGSAVSISRKGVETASVWNALPFICEFPRLKGLRLVHYINPERTSWCRAKKTCENQGAALAYQGLQSINDRVAKIGGAGTGNNWHLYVGFYYQSHGWKNMAEEKVTKKQLIWGKQRDQKGNCAIINTGDMTTESTQCSHAKYGSVCQKMI